MGPLFNRRMAVAAIQTQLAGVERMGIGDRLYRCVSHICRLRSSPVVDHAEHIQGYKHPADCDARPEKVRPLGEDES